MNEIYPSYLNFKFELVKQEFLIESKKGCYTVTNFLCKNYLIFLIVVYL